MANPIAERFGLDWKSQTRKLRDDPALSEGMVVMTIPSPGGMQETTGLRLDLLNGWLFRIDPRPIKPEVREALIACQRECYAVLSRRFQPTTAERIQTNGIPRRFDDGLTTVKKVSLVCEARLAHGRGSTMGKMIPISPA